MSGEGDKMCSYYDIIKQATGNWKQETEEEEEEEKLSFEFCGCNVDWMISE